MSDELGLDEAQDETLDATLEAEDTESQQSEVSDEEAVDWQKRYSDLQPEYTRTTQRVKELEPLADWKPVLDDLNNPNDPLARQRALNFLQEQFGGDLDEEETGDEGMDEFRDPRVDGLLAQNQQREAEQALGQLNGHVDQLLKDADVTVTDRQRRALMNECIEAGFNPETTQDVVKAWVDDLGNSRNEIIKAYRDGKLKQPAPPVRSGASGTEHVPLNTGKARQKAALDIANEAFQ
jgi:hypothetical protein